MTLRKHKIGIIGCGYWGTNLIRNFMESPRADLTSIADLDQKRLDKFSSLYGTLKTTQDWRTIVEDPEIDVVSVTTPVSGHFEPALAALNAGKHVMIAKPMAASSEQCKRLIDAAKKNNRKVILDHTFVYTDSVRMIKDLMQDGTLGNVLYYDSTRINLGLFQTDASVVWDLAVHDLAIIDYLFEERPSAVSCIATGHVQGSPENIAFLTLFFPSGMIAHINVNWMSPVKVRQILVGGDKKMVVFDDTEATEKIRIYDRGVSVTQDKDQLYKQMMTYRLGGVEIPALRGNEALKTEIHHFFDCIEQDQTPITDAEHGLRTVQLLEAINLSMAQKGRAFDLPQISEAA